MSVREGLTDEWVIRDHTSGWEAVRNAVAGYLAVINLVLATGRIGRPEAG